MKQPSRRYSLVIRAEGNTLADVLDAMTRAAVNIRRDMNDGKREAWGLRPLEVDNAFIALAPTMDSCGHVALYSSARVVESEDRGRAWTEQRYQDEMAKYIGEVRRDQKMRLAALRALKGKL